MTSPPSPPVPASKRSLLLKLSQGLVAVGATFGYVVFILSEFGHPPAWPLHLGFGLFLLLLWWIAIRGGRSLAKAAAGTSALAFALIVIGAINLARAEAALRAELDRYQQNRLALEPGQGFHEKDAFGLECEKVFGRDAFQDEAFDWNRMSVQPNRDYPEMARRIEERRPGWPRVLQMFARANIVEGVPVRTNYREDAYGGRIQVACGRYFSTLLGLSSYNSLSAYVRREKRLLELAEADRAIFLKAWKDRPKDPP